MEKKRCINLDWLEVYCLEDYIGYPHDAQFFRDRLFHVEEREYGTPVYHEMFTVFGSDDKPLLEIRRSPKSAIGKQLNGVLDPMACHIRLVNRTCYFSNPAQILQQFLEQYGFHYQRISRIDIALDFEVFDYGDMPDVFVRRYMEGRYAKINQANLSAHGKDQWDGRIWNSLKWGAPKSMISTKFYNKTMEIREKSDKPYIRQAWRLAGLIEDDYLLTRHRDDGTEYQPDIWRVEFSIQSGTRNWFIIEDVQGQKKKIRSIRNDLSMYQTRQQLLDMFFSLADHYFHFKKYKPATRKDRCPDKLLFNPQEQSIFYKLENAAVSTNDEPDKQLSRLLAKLQEYFDTAVMPDVKRACLIIMQDIEKQQRTVSLPHPWPKEELFIIRQLLAKRIKGSNATLSQDLNEIKGLTKLYTDLFGES